MDVQYLPAMSCSKLLPLNCNWMTNTKYFHNLDTIACIHTPASVPDDCN